MLHEKRDFREETLLNAAEEVSLNWAAGKLGVSKSSLLRMGLLRIVDDLKRNERLIDTGLITE